jgi:DHA1 family multidrug resistance protein-like MFS transporter
MSSHDRATKSSASDDNYSPWADERVRAVCVSTGCVMLGHGVATPILPAFAAELGGAAADVGMAFAAFGAARLALNIPVGAAVDSVGRKPVLVAGAGLSALGMCASGFAADIPSLICARLIAGAGASCYLGGVQVYLADIAQPRTRARVLGANHAALLLGVSLGPVIGGATAELMGVRAPFTLIAALNGVAAVHALVALRETLPSAIASTTRSDPHAAADATAGATAKQPPPTAPPSTTSGPPGTSTSGGLGWRAALRDPQFVGAGVAHMANFALRQGGRNMLLALVAVEVFGYSSAQLGMLFGAMATTDLMAVSAASRAADRAHADARGVVIPGILGAAAACACVGLLSAEWADWGAAGDALEQVRHPLFLGAVAAWAVATASVGPALPAFAAGLAREPAHRGAYVALFRTSGDVGFVLAPVALGYLADYSGAPSAMVALAGVVASAAGLFGVIGRPRG